MHPLLEPIIRKYRREFLPDFKVGQTIKIFQKIKEGEKERIQAYEGMIIAYHKTGNLDESITVRKIVDGIGVERTFPVHTPLITKIEVLKETLPHRSKLYYIRKLAGKAAKMKTVAVKNQVFEPKPYSNTIPVKNEPAEALQPSL